MSVTLDSEVGIDLTVEIDLSGTNYGDSPTWTDVTEDVWVTGGSGVQMTWGRQDWISNVYAASCSFTLDNHDGKYTPRLSSSPYYPNVKRRARCRVRADVTVPAGGLSFTDDGDGTLTMSGPAGYVEDVGNRLLIREGGFEAGPSSGTLTYTGSDAVRTVYLFDGLIDSWEASWEGGIYGLCAVSATDMLGRYGTELPLRPMLHEEILKDLGPGNTGFFFPLNDQGPTLGNIKGDTGGTVAPLQAFAGPGAPDVAFQADTGCADPAVTGVTLGGFFSYIAGSWFAVTSAGCAEMFFSTTFTGAEAVLFGDVDDDLGIGIDVDGNIGDGTTTGPFVADGQIHQLVYVPGTGWYIDGALIGDVAIDTISSIGFNLVGTVFCFALIDGPPSLERLAEHLRVARRGGAGESTDEHVARLLSYRTTFGSSLDVGRGRVGVHGTDSETLQQALYDTSDAEGGVLYADGQARIVLRSRAHLFDPTPDMILDASSGQVDATTVFRDDTQFIVNRVTVTGASGAAQLSEDTDSITADGLVEQNVTLIVRGDNDAKAAATWRVQVGVQEQVATPQLDIDLFTIDDANTVLAVLETRPLDVVTLDNLPASTPTVGDFMVQGGSLTISAQEFRASLFTTVKPAGTAY